MFANKPLHLLVRLAILTALVCVLPPAALSQSPRTINFAQLSIKPGPVSLSLKFHVPSGFELNGQGPFTVEVTNHEPDVAAFENPPPPLSAKSFPLILKGEARKAGTTVVLLRIKAYFCTADRKACYLEHLAVSQPMLVQEGGADRLSLKVPLRR